MAEAKRRIVLSSLHALPRDRHKCDYAEFHKLMLSCQLQKSKKFQHQISEHGEPYSRIRPAGGTLNINYKIFKGPGLILSVMGTTGARHE
jgi:hypothetical protein